MRILGALPSSFLGGCGDRLLILLLRAAFVALPCLSVTRLAVGQGSDPRSDVQSWAVTPRRIESPLMKYRLLPAEQELREGNAAPILLRLPWDQIPFMSNVLPKFAEQLEIPLSDAQRIRIAGGDGSLNHSFSEMRRAAYRRSASWEYPIAEEPLGRILVPDVGGLHRFTCGLAVRIRAQIVNDELDGAREGILVGLANSRHVAQTPFLVNKMVGAKNGELMLDRVVELLQQSSCPNLYWALTAVPAPFIAARPMFELERNYGEEFVGGPADGARSRSPEEWGRLSDRLMRHLVDEYQSTKGTIKESDALDPKKINDQARAELPALVPDAAERIAVMSDGEVFVRWILARHLDACDRATACASLRTADAISRLRPLDEEVDRFGRPRRKMIRSSGGNSGSTGKSA